MRIRIEKYIIYPATSYLPLISVSRAIIECIPCKNCNHNAITLTKLCLHKLRSTRSGELRPRNKAPSRS